MVSNCYQVANALVQMRSLRILNVRNLPRSRPKSPFPAECECRALIIILTNILALRGALYHRNPLDTIALGAPIHRSTSLDTPDRRQDLLQFRVYHLEKRYESKAGVSTAFDLIFKGIVNEAFERTPYAKFFTSYWLA